MSQRSTMPDKKILVCNSTPRKQVGFCWKVELWQNKTVPWRPKATSSQSDFLS